jgi:hypothetical protein
VKNLLTIGIALGLVAGCGTGAGDFDLSVRRVALSLAFADEDKAEPIAPNVIVRLIPAPPEALVDGADLSNIPLSMPPKCPVAPEGAPMVDVGTYGIHNTPAPGTYRRHNEGALLIKGALELRIPFPRETRWEYSAVTEVPPPSPVDDPSAPAAGADNLGDNFPPGEPEGKVYEYTVTKILTGEFSITDTIRLTPRRMILLKRETTSTGVTTTFTPDPPVTLLEHADGEGHEFRSAGVDNATGTAMVVDGLVEKREAVDVCGTVHDTLRVVVSEQMVNLAEGGTSGTASGEPNVYNIATQLGGLVVREDLHFTQTITQADGTAAVVEWDYVSTINSAQPEPPK